MSAPPGWYPDPAGAPGRFRFWDGRTWGQVTADRPDAPTPAAPYAPTPPAPTSYAPTSYASNQYAPTAYAPRPVIQPPRSRWGWWLGAAALFLAVIVVGVLVVRSVGGGLSGGTGRPGDDPTQETCPRTSSSASPVRPSTSERVRSGQLSYPRLPAPFGAPGDDYRTPFGHDVQSQHAEVERSRDGETIWVAWALIARLLAGDGFYGPEQGAAVVADCVVAMMYNDHEINRTDTLRKALTVDGHQAYLIESHLTFDIPGIQAKGETMIVVVIDVGTNGEAGLFYGTIPDNAPQFMAPIRETLARLQVG